VNDGRRTTGGARRSPRLWSIRSCFVLTLAGTLTAAAWPAAAEVELKKAGPWTLSLDGRLNTFYSFARGDSQPQGVAVWGGGVETRAPPDQPTFQSSRIRSGFVTNVLGFSLTRQLSETTKLTGRFAFWVATSQDRSKFDVPAVDTRELYIKLEGPWGSLLTGRNLGLFGRGGISVDYDIHHGLGLGSPCSIRVSGGGSCGFVGHGILFPQFNAGIVYATPDLFGLQLAVGAYDPAINSARLLDQTPYPRIEAQLSYHFKQYVRVFVETLWQRLQHELMVLHVDTQGIAGGGMISIGPFAAGGSVFRGKGLGLFVPMEPSPLFASSETILRPSRGVMGVASLTFGGTKIAGGAGASYLDKTASEPTPLPSETYVRQQLGISAGFYQTFWETMTVALEYFRGQYRWHDIQDTASMELKSPKQNVNFINAGLTIVW
jgi:hypothetical protein